MCTRDKHRARSKKSYHQNLANMQHHDQYTVWGQRDARERKVVENAVSTLTQAHNPSRDRGQ